MAPSSVNLKGKWDNVGDVEMTVNKTQTIRSLLYFAVYAGKTLVDRTGTVWYL